MSAPKPLVLIADDDPAIIKALEFRLKGWGYSVASALDKGQLLRSLQDQRPAVVLLDVRFGEHDGVELLQEVLAAPSSPTVIIMTAFGTIAGAVAAMRLGAQDYLTKPPDLPRLKFLVDDAVEAREEASLDSGSPAPPTRAETQAAARMIGESPPVQRLRELIAAVAPTDATVLILGESGTGKEVTARAIHAQSNRAARPFLPLNMAALPRELVESTLFGHERGAFTGADQAQQGAVEAADGGTLFLDEIGEMDIDLQAKLLRFLQERTVQRVGSSKLKSVDVRFIAATNRDPVEQVRNGRLREDLYYRLNVVPIHMPPLRERREDIPGLVRHFIHRVAGRYGKTIEGVSPEAMARLIEYRWPGNIRQLENLAERLVIFSRGPEIGLADLPGEVLADSPLPSSAVPPASPAFGSGPGESTPDQESDSGEILRPIDQIEKQAIIDALRRSGGNVRAAAKLIGLGQATVYRKIKRYGIQTD